MKQTLVNESLFLSALLKEISSKLPRKETDSKDKEHKFFFPFFLSFLINA